MRTENLVLTATILVGAAACGGSSDSVTGMRFDGVKVTCNKQSDDVSTCAPMASDPCDAATVLWPPNHKMIQFTLAACAPAPGCGGGGSGSGSGSGGGSGSGSGGGSGSGSGSGVILRTTGTADATGTADVTGAHITSITADEAVEVGAGGDGHTTKFDMQIVDPVTFALRSERQGGGDGRVYRVNYVDDAGADASCEFDVPHDQGPTRGAADSGVVVTLTP
jgi:hypothetical protein